MAGQLGQFGTAPGGGASRSRGRAALRRGRIAAAVGALLAIAALIIVLIVALGSGSSKSPPRKPSHPHLAAKLCPLTGMPAPGGVVPKRPAVAVKVGNEPQGARPQSGLDEADIVYDTPAEGFIMRYIAVFQCGSASSIGPTRSVRWVDYHILQPFGRPIIAFAGGIDPNVHAVEHLGWLQAADLLTNAAQAGTRITSRVPPDNLYTSTSALLALFPHDRTPPLPVFDYSTRLPRSARPASKVGINFSAGTDVVWVWQPSDGLWLHTYAGSSPPTDVDVLANRPVTTANVVIQIVHYKYGPYVESTGGTGDVESQTVGTGSGYILRNGKVIRVLWHRPTLNDITTFTDSAGRPVALTPGRTWVELVPDTTAKMPGAITITG